MHVPVGPWDLSTLQAAAWLLADGGLRLGIALRKPVPGGLDPKIRTEGENK